MPFILAKLILALSFLVSAVHHNDAHRASAVHAATLTPFDSPGANPKPEVR